MQGWIMLHRKLLENPIMKKPELLQLFIYCLLKANHEEGKAFWGKDEIVVQRGQFVTGRFELAEAVKQKPDTTYKRLNKLVELGYLNTESNNKNTLVTIVNYDFYQSIDEKSNNKSNRKVTTKSQQSNTNNNDNNDNNDKKIITMVPYEEIVSLYNSICVSLPQVRDITKTRRSHMNARYTQHKSIETFKDIFEKVEASDFLTNRKKKNKNSWKADFNWLIDNDINMVKVLEGKYDNKEDEPNGPNDKHTGCTKVDIEEWQPGKPRYQNRV